MKIDEFIFIDLFSQRPATELVRAVNKFKADFGGQVVSLERVQPSSDHVPHRFGLFLLLHFLHFFFVFDHLLRFIGQRQ